MLKKSVLPQPIHNQKNPKKQSKKITQNTNPEKSESTQIINTQPKKEEKNSEDILIWGDSLIKIDKLV